MDIYEAIEKRRTIRIFKQGVTEAQLRKLLLAGAKAPSSGNRQSWEFIVIDDPKTIDQIGEIKYKLNRKFPPGSGESQKEVEERALNQKKWFRNASVVAVCNRSGDAATGWLAVENISLAAVADGLGTNIIAFFGEEKKEMENLLGLPGDYELNCVLKVGVPEGEAKKPVIRPEFSWLHKNKF
jgi:5,6-dimethylbenzimidazole synthase